MYVPIAFFIAEFYNLILKVESFAEIFGYLPEDLTCMIIRQLIKL